MQTDRNLLELSKKNAKLKEREKKLVSSLDALHKIYYDMIKKNCDCIKEADDTKYCDDSEK